VYSGITFRSESSATLLFKPQSLHHIVTSSSMKSSGFYCISFALSEREDLNVDGVHPSSDPTELKNPAENPPVKAP
jgi:hypothetical protein